MKRFLLVSGFLALTHWSMGQTFGLRAGMETSNSQLADKSLGLGAYVSFDNFSDKFEVMIHGDYFRKKDKVIESEGAFYSFDRRVVGVAGLYNFAFSENIRFKLGPDINYNWIQAHQRGLVLQWYKPYDGEYTGLGVMTNLHFRQIFDLPINLDVFATPNYLIRAKAEGGSMADRTMKQLNLQVGVSYPIRKK